MSILICFYSTLVDSGLAHVGSPSHTGPHPLVTNVVPINHPPKMLYHKSLENHPQISLVGGKTTPLKNDGLKVSWDDDIPN